jgi:hypothetical protein
VSPDSFVPCNTPCSTFAVEFAARLTYGIATKANASKNDLMIEFLSSVKTLCAGPERYSIFGITVDRRQSTQWISPQGKATFKVLQKVYVYSENALNVVW